MISVGIIEDHDKYRELLAFLIAGSDGYRVTASYRTMEDALERIGTDVPDVALVDLGLPRMSGIEGIRRLKEQYPRLLLLVLTVYDDDERIFEALSAGASGYLLKKTPPVRLLGGIEEAVAGGAPMSPHVARRVIAVFQSSPPRESADYSLTHHELRILKLLVEGHSYKTAAATLGVAVGTVSFHVQKVYEKLHVHSKSEAVAKALRHRLV